VDLQAFQDQLSSEDESTRAFAAEDAGFENRSDCVSTLANRLPMESSRFVREAIFSALARISDPSVCDAVIPLLRSEDVFLRNACVALLQQKGNAALDILEPLASDADPDVRKLVLDAVSTMQSPRVDKALSRALNDPEINVRIAAVEYDRASTAHCPPFPPS
jgi:HEAT repeat protein